MVQYIVLKVISDALDPFILWLTQIALAMASFSVAVSIFLLIDYFKRHGWQYSKYRKIKKPVKSDLDKDREFDKDNPM